jgi:hypothetical protein
MKELASRYDVFVSYSHHDAPLAERLSRRIRTYRPPRVTGLARRKIVIFRDRERLTTSADLAATLSETVGASEHLVLLASPAAAQSPYVDQEVAAFLERKDESHVSIVMCSGNLPDNLPPTLRARLREPLYIDLRGAGRRTFRLESLRLIARLLGVNYSELRREDEQRRRRRQALAVAAAMLLAFAIGSGYLVTTTPAEAWEHVTQPEANAGPDPLMPVERIAVSANDPSVVVWLGDNARYQRDLANVKETWAPATDELDSFEGRVRTALAAEPNPDLGIRPVATAALEAAYGRDPIGSGDLRIYAFFDNGRLRFSRTFRFTPATTAMRAITLPLTAVEEGRGPFDLEPWVADALRRAKLDPSAMTIRGVVQDHTTDEVALPVEFATSDNRADIREVLAATAGPEHIVLSSSEEVASELRERLEGLGAEDLWNELAKDAAWAVYQPPQRAKPLTFARDAADLREGARAAGVDAGLAAAIDPALVEGDLVELEQVSRTTGIASVAVATVTGIIDHHEAVAAARPAHYLHASGRWTKIALPLETVTTRIVDVVPIDPELRTIMVVSDREGVFRTLDGGSTWHSADFREPRLRNGERVRLIVAASTVYALAAIRSQPGDDPNPVLRLTHRDWIRRWRLGLAGWLTGSNS